MFKPMLAATVTDVDNLRFPLVISPKLDGIRATVQNGVLVSRKLRPINNKYVSAIFSIPELEGIDGELICGDPTTPQVFWNTSSAVMSYDGSPQVVYWVFDLFSDLYFQQRFHNAAQAIHGLKDVILVSHHIIRNLNELNQWEEEFVSLGYEGAMLRSPIGPYKQGRSTEREGYLLKLKRFKDGEAIIIGFEEQMQNTNKAEVSLLGKTKRSHKKEGMVAKGTLGSLRVKDVSSGLEFNVGTGMDDELRVEIWQDRDKFLSQTIAYKYQVCGTKDKPRLPIFKGFRNEGE